MQIFYRTSITLMHPTPNTQHPEPNTQHPSRFTRIKGMAKVWQRYGTDVDKTSTLNSNRKLEFKL